MSIWWSLHLRREAASVPLARRLLLGTMETAGVDPEISYDLSVALTEACANAVEHARGSGPGAESGEYRVTAHIDGDRCHIEVTDSGPGFSPAHARRRTRPTGRAAHHRESGRGLCLIESLVDSVHFHNRPGRGAVVSFEKVLKWRDHRPAERAPRFTRARENRLHEPEPRSGADHFLSAGQRALPEVLKR